MQAEQRGFPVSVPRPSGLAEPHVRGENGVANVPPDVPFLVERRGAEPVEAKPAPALPADGLGDAALLAFDDLAQARRAVGDGVLAHLDADVAPAHLVRNGSGGAGAEEGVEDEVALVRCYVKHARHELLGLHGVENVNTGLNLSLMRLCLPRSLDVEKNGGMGPSRVSGRVFASVGNPNGFSVPLALFPDDLVRRHHLEDFFRPKRPSRFSTIVMDRPNILTIRPGDGVEHRGSVLAKTGFAVLLQKPVAMPAPLMVFSWIGIQDRGIVLLLETHREMAPGNWTVR